MNKMKLKSFITIAMLSSISCILMFLNFPLPYFPVFLEIDFSDVPALIAAIIMGPVAGIIVELIKNILNWIFIGAPTGVPVGHIANFTTGLLFILPVYYLYKKSGSLKGLMMGLIAGTFTMAIGMSILNYVAFLPMYTYFLGMGGFDAKEMIVLGILPFNFIKGIMLMVLVMMLFRTMRRWIENQRAQYLLQKQ
ncbi:ECF transporter S component [Ureibacillus sp. FSL K6-8385]|uniref:Riboflavin transporter n=1 Tax=Ureibacillus terrenus TaxID=118246 RepID=A0A540V6M9_9BACL|nr:ECF transporter S component [Ureibacillus terrenus]MED3660600.1 ECF transporter S component [Ureibacillus terrenus]MED3762720.1 ECF transporter S component [Ureibacillus terrenus]TQE92406.1 ECF transporter S component [Ureibacillus terrenus]